MLKHHHYLLLDALLLALIVVSLYFVDLQFTLSLVHCTAVGLFRPSKPSGLMVVNLWHRLSRFLTLFVNNTCTCSYNYCCCKFTVLIFVHVTAKFRILNIRFQLSWLPANKSYQCSKIFDLSK